MDNSAQQVIDNVLENFGGAWQSIEEIAKHPDGNTKLKILQQHFPDADIMGMDRDEVSAQLEKAYWPRIQGDRIDSPVAAEKLIEGVVFLGLDDAVRLAQQAANVKSIDGIMGPQTLAGINKMGEERFVERFGDEMDNFVHMNKLPPEASGMDFSKSSQFEQVGRKDFPPDFQTRQPEQPPPEKSPYPESPGRRVDQVFAFIEEMHLSDKERNHLKAVVQEALNTLNKPDGVTDETLDTIQRDMDTQLKNVHISNEERDRLAEYFSVWLEFQ